MNEDALYNLIGRLWVDLRSAHARIQQLQQRIDELTAPKSEPPPDAQGQ